LIPRTPTIVPITRGKNPKTAPNSTFDVNPNPRAVMKIGYSVTLGKAKMVAMGAVTPDFVVEVNMGRDEIVDSIMLHVRGVDSAVGFVSDLLAHWAYGQSTFRAVTSSTRHRQPRASLLGAPTATA
jgi:hypothetical protein